jgi:hypothetical protein
VGTELEVVLEVVVGYEELVDVDGAAEWVYV